MFNFPLNFLIFLSVFCDPIVCYLGILASISNTQIVQWMWFCPTPQTALPVIKVALFYLKQSLRARVFSEQVIVFEIRFVR